MCVSYEYSPPRRRLRASGAIKGHAGGGALYPGGLSPRRGGGGFAGAGVSGDAVTGGSGAAGATGSGAAGAGGSGVPAAGAADATCSAPSIAREQPEQEQRIGRRGGAPICAARAAEFIIACFSGVRFSNES